VLTKDVAAMADAIARESEIKKEISHIHGQAIYQSYCLRIREACHTFKPLAPSLTSAVKGLYSLLARLARTANVHAGNLHKVMFQDIVVLCVCVCVYEEGSTYTETNSSILPIHFHGI